MMIVVVAVVVDGDPGIFRTETFLCYCFYMIVGGKILKEEDDKCWILHAEKSRVGKVYCRSTHAIDRFCDNFQKQNEREDLKISDLKEKI